MNGQNGHSAEKDAGRIRGSDWAVYFGILTAVFVSTLLLAGSVVAALNATCGGVLAATWAAQMTTRAYRTRVTPPAEGRA